MKVKADKFNQVKKRMEQPFTMGSFDPVPVDMYGHIVTMGKSDQNIKDAAKDIQTYYDMAGDRGLS